MTGNAKARRTRPKKKITNLPAQGEPDTQGPTTNIIAGGARPSGQGIGGTSSLPDYLSRPFPDRVVPAGRIFETGVYPSHFAQEDIESTVGPWTLVAHPSSRNKCPCCMQYDSQHGWLIISIAGHCLNKGRDDPSSRSAIGVYFGKDNENNISASLNRPQHTTQIAELNACIAALQRVIAIWKMATPTGGNDPWHPMRLVVIKTDSPYLVNGVTEWLPKWKENGWKGCKGQKIANDDLWRVIDRWIQHLEAEISVQFWLVSKAQNGIADWMAHRSLNKT